MTRLEYAQKLVKQKYDTKEYDFQISFDKLKWSGELVDVTLNDGRTELVDRLVEFTLCSLHSFYFIDRYAKTADTKKGPIPFKLFDFQKKMLLDFQLNKRVIFRKCRQIGASVTTGAYALWRANFQKGQIIKIISLSQRDAQEFKEKTIDLNYMEMPGFLKSAATRDGNNRSKLKLVNGSQITITPKSKNAARGSTPSLVIVDEAAFNEWMDDIWASVEPALDHGGDCIIISTTNGVGNWYHVTYTRAEAGENEFHPIFVPWWRFPGRDNPWLDDLITGKIEDPETFIKQKEAEALNYKGPVHDAPWLFKKRANSKTEKIFLQEYMAEFLGSGSTLISAKTITDLTVSIEKPKWVNTLPGGSKLYNGLWCWREVDRNHTYIMTVDTATGHGKDYSVLELVDLNTKEQVAEFRGQIPPNEFADVIKDVARYYNEAYVIIECNNPGPAAFYEVYSSKTDPYYNCYVRNKSGHPWGWDTTPRSRNLMIEDLYKDVENKFTKIYSSRLIEEFKTLAWQENGKVEAHRGYNDDLAIAWAMYSHLWESSLGSKPLGLTSSKKSMTYDSNKTVKFDWSKKEKEYLRVYGCSLEEYYWLNGLDLPEDYLNWKESEEDSALLR